MWNIVINETKPALPTITKEDRTPLVDALLELLAWQMKRIEALEQEVLKLKGETTKPKIKPSKTCYRLAEYQTPNGGRYFRTIAIRAESTFCGCCSRDSVRIMC